MKRPAMPHCFPTAFAAALVLFAGGASAQWKYGSMKDAMTDQVRISATLASPTKFQLSFPYAGGTNGWLILRQETAVKGPITQALFTVNRGQVIATDGIAIKFDDAETVTFSAEGPSDGSAQLVFLEFPGAIEGCSPEKTPKQPGESNSGWIERSIAAENAAKVACHMTERQFANRLASASRVRLQATLYDAGRRVFEFKPQGLKWPE